jgi:guanylate cyclase, other
LDLNSVGSTDFNDTGFQLSRTTPAGSIQKVSLYDIFPEPIARALLEGRKVEAEHRDVVTIFFSDIVGFTTISSSLDPRKVADMLDRLYSVFDELSIKHDVFKVETIGDSYMAVTNLVKDQPDDHAKRIARFAIEALDEARKVEIDTSDPNRGCVSIRVGFHSGPVVADVVGNRNPRYCLFGDTVNTASRMESNSIENRIHCSEQSALLLRKQDPELPIASRGLIDIKGKGKMFTYWVNEEEDENIKRGMGQRSRSMDIIKQTKKQESKRAKSLFKPSKEGEGPRSSNVDHIDDHEFLVDATDVEEFITALTK